MKGNMYRTYNCSELREENVGEEIKLAGWCCCDFKGTVRKA